MIERMSRLGNAQERTQRKNIPPNHFGTESDLVLIIIAGRPAGDSHYLFAQHIYDTDVCVMSCHMTHSTRTLVLLLSC